VEAPFNIHDLPRPERPRERFAQCGPEALSAYELLAIILGNGIKGESAILIAQKTLKAFSNLKGLSQASIEELSSLKESFILLILDARNVVKRIRQISIGILDSSLIHPREVFKEAIQALASSIILVHNHPSGNPEPSEMDVEITRIMVDAGSLIGIRVLDHVIIAQQEYYSFQEHEFFSRRAS
jgi:DNA repair protein RadC